MLQERLDPQLCDVAPVRQCEALQPRQAGGLVMFTTDILEDEV